MSGTSITPITFQPTVGDGEAIEQRQRTRRLLQRLIARGRSAWWSWSWEAVDELCVGVWVGVDELFGFPADFV